jgi:RHS repeat-associated protein
VFDGAGNQTHRYLHGTGVDTVLADETPTQVLWALADNQGTVRDIVDGNGVILNHVTYDSFGKVQSQSNAGVEFRYGYAGREADTETGLDYYRARYYDSANGRFISEDPIGFGGGDSNLTRYVGNNPTNFNDPSGLCVFVLAAPAVAPAVGSAIPPALYWLAGILGVGGIINGLNNSGFNPFTIGNNDQPLTLPPFHNPLYLGDNLVEGFPNHPVDPLPPLGGFNLFPDHSPIVEGFPNNSHNLPPWQEGFNLGQGNGNNLVEGFPHNQDHSGLPQYVFQASPKVENILQGLHDNGILTNPNSKPNTLKLETQQEGNVTLDLGGGKTVNIRVETHPLEQGGEPVRHANIQVM